MQTKSQKFTRKSAKQNTVFVDSNKLEQVQNKSTQDLLRSFKPQSAKNIDSNKQIRSFQTNKTSKFNTGNQVVKSNTYIKFQPQLMESVNDNNQKELKLQFVNEISNFQIEDNMIKKSHQQELQQKVDTNTLVMISPMEQYEKRSTNYSKQIFFNQKCIIRRPNQKQLIQYP